jgi:pantoate kinase
MSSTHAVAYSPCQITGFFRVHLRQGDAAKSGSTGAGVALEHGVTTEVSIRESSRIRVKVSYNGKPLWNPVVSRSVVHEYLGGEPNPLEVSVSHHSLLPIGRGYGTSGAGALGLSLSLNEALGNPLSNLEAAGVAHRAEVERRTGLGTVTGAFHGGFLARLKPGTPGAGEVRRLPVSKNDRVVSASLGPIPTTRILSQTELVRRINSCGKSLVAKLLQRPSLDRFLEISRSFAECLNLMSPRVRRIVKVTDREGVCASMMMIGDAAFTVVNKDRVRSVSRIVGRLGLVPLTSKITPRGAHLL